MDRAVPNAYADFVASLFREANKLGDETGHLVEKIVSNLDQTPSTDLDKMAVLAMLRTKLDDKEFLLQQFDVIHALVSSRHRLLFPPQKQDKTTTRFE